MLFEFVGRVVSRVLHLGLCRHDLVEKLALAVLGTRFDIRLRHGDRLAEHATVRRGQHDHPGGRGPLEHCLPFIWSEGGLRCHRTAPALITDTAEFRLSRLFPYAPHPWRG